MCYIGSIARAYALGMLTAATYSQRQLFPTLAPLLFTKLQVVEQRLRTRVQPPLYYGPFNNSRLIELGRRPPFRADSKLPVTWGRPQPLQGWF